MRFADPSLQNDLEAWRRQSDHRERATADNVVFEERVGDSRRVWFENFARDGRYPGEVRRSVIQYVRDHMEIQAGVPHTFAANLEPAILSPAGLEPTQWIVRLESLKRIFAQWAVLSGQESSLERLQAAKDANDTPVLNKFCEIWNDSVVRDFRPAFAAWRGELETELEADDWPDRLRDRLGLEHYNCVDGPVPVALMMYQVKDVVAPAGAGTAFTAPTVLDSQPGPYFFPAPRNVPYGRVMSLIADDDDLLAEMLHVRIPYRPEHIAKLGYIARPSAGHDLKELRNHHLLALQVATSREDFGEDIP